VLARDAAAADAAATLIANRVDLDHPAIERRPAASLRDDSDLGDIPVTAAVGPLEPAAIDAALASGAAEAERMRRAGLIVAAALFCVAATAWSATSCCRGPAQGASRLAGPRS